MEKTKKIEKVIIYSVPEDIDWLIPITKNTIQEASFLHIDTIIDVETIREFEDSYSLLNCSGKIQDTDILNIIAKVHIDYYDKRQDTLLIEAIKKDLYKNSTICKDFLPLYRLLSLIINKSKNIDYL
jgi:hypothetical protein